MENRALCAENQREKEMTSFLTAIVACILIALTAGIVMKSYQKDAAEGYSTSSVRQSPESETQDRRL
jgi:hypothetical protein